MGIYSPASIWFRTSVELSAPLWINHWHSRKTGDRTPKWLLSNYQLTADCKQRSLTQSPSSLKSYELTVTMCVCVCSQLEFTIFSHDKCVGTSKQIRSETRSLCCRHVSVAPLSEYNRCGNVKCQFCVELNEKCVVDMLTKAPGHLSTAPVKIQILPTNLLLSPGNWSVDDGAASWPRASISIPHFDYFHLNRWVSVSFNADGTPSKSRATNVPFGGSFKRNGTRREGGRWNMVINSE